MTIAVPKLPILGSCYFLRGIVGVHSFMNVFIVFFYKNTISILNAGIIAYVIYKKLNYYLSKKNCPILSKSPFIDQDNTI